MKNIQLMTEIEDISGWEDFPCELIARIIILQMAKWQNKSIDTRRITVEL